MYACLNVIARRTGCRVLSQLLAKSNLCVPQISANISRALKPSLHHRLISEFSLFDLTFMLQIIISAFDPIVLLAGFPCLSDGFSTVCAPQSRPKESPDLRPDVYSLNQRINEMMVFLKTTKSRR